MTRLHPCFLQPVSDRIRPRSPQSVICLKVSVCPLMSEPRPHCATKVPPSPQGMHDILASRRYRALVLDQFGVLHDGRNPYLHARVALSKLRAAYPEMYIVVLSNSSRRASQTAKRLRTDMHLTEVDDVLTSGELSRALLRDTNELSADGHSNTHSGGPLLSNVKSAVHLNWCGRGSIDPVDAGVPALAWEGLPPSAEVCSVDAVVAHGTEGASRRSGGVERADWAAMRSFCVELANARPEAPFVVVNPDLVTVDGGHLRKMPGLLAKHYEEAGGVATHRIGKPGKLAYDRVLEMCASRGVGPEEVLCVGDSAGHDILGALRAEPGLDVVYVAGGINATDFGLDPFGGDDTERSWEIDWEIWDRIVEKESPGCGRPTYCIPYFRW